MSVPFSNLLGTIKPISGYCYAGMSPTLLQFPGRRTWWSPHKVNTNRSGWITRTKTPTTCKYINIEADAFFHEQRFNSITDAPADNARPTLNTSLPIEGENDKTNQVNSQKANPERAAAHHFGALALPLYKIWSSLIIPILLFFPKLLV